MNYIEDKKNKKKKRNDKKKWMQKRQEKRKKCKESIEECNQKMNHSLMLEKLNLDKMFLNFFG